MTNRQILLLFLIAKGVTRRRKLYEAIGNNSALGLSEQLKKLHSQGLIEREFHKTGMTLTDAGRQALGKYALVNGKAIWEVVRHIEDKLEEPQYDNVSEPS